MFFMIKRYITNIVVNVIRQNFFLMCLGFGFLLICLTSTRLHSSEGPYTNARSGNISVDSAYNNYYWPTIVKIDVAGNDTLILVEHNENYFTFKFTGQEFIPFYIESYKVVDFQKYKDDNVLYILKKGSFYAVASHDRVLADKLVKRPRLVDAGFNPAFINNDTLFCFDKNLSVRLKYNLMVSKWKDFKFYLNDKNLGLLTKLRNGYTSLIGNHFFVSIINRVGKGIFLDFNLKSTGMPLEYKRMDNIYNAMIINDTVFLAGESCYLGPCQCTLNRYDSNKDCFFEIINNYHYWVRGTNINDLLELGPATFDEKTGVFYYATNLGLAEIRNSHIEKITEYSSYKIVKNDEPRGIIKLIGDDIYFCTYGGRLGKLSLKSNESYIYSFSASNIIYLKSK